MPCGLHVILGSAFGTTTRYFFFLFVVGLAIVCDRIAALLEGVNTGGTTSFLHCIERDDYTDKCYVD
jgi:hypothetical protein